MRDEQGSVTAFVAVVAASLVLVAGMVVDGGQVLSAGVDAQRLAASAARAGAQELSVDALRSTGRPILEPRRATRSAEEFLDAAGAQGSVRVSASHVAVTVTVELPMRVLPLPSRQITVTRTAEAVAGVTAPGDLP